MSTKAPTGLAAFTRKQLPQPVSTVSPAEAITDLNERRRGKGDTVSMTVRLSRADWERVHQLAVAEGTSIQRLALDGFSKVFAEKGLPGLTD